VELQAFPSLYALMVVQSDVIGEILRDRIPDYRSLDASSSAASPRRRS
jgi:hypothetical protein